MKTVSCEEEKAISGRKTQTNFSQTSARIRSHPLNPAPSSCVSPKSSTGSFFLKICHFLLSISRLQFASKQRDCKKEEG